MNTYLSLQIRPQRYNIFHYDVPITEIFFKNTAHYTKIAPHSELMPLHICPVGTLPVAHRVVKAEHGSSVFFPITHEEHPLCRCRRGQEDRWQRAALHLMAFHR